jgi:FkbM family methyltransferase
MRIILAKIFRQLFKLQFFRIRFYGIHQRIFKPYNLFKGVVCSVNYNGFILQLKLDDWIQENIFFLGEYEKAELKVLANHLKPGEVFLDLGANLGVFTLHASKIVGKSGKVISFEPFSINHNALVEHIRINNLLNVKIEKLAVGSEPGSITLYLDESEDNLGMVTANYVENAVVEKVEIVSIDGYLETHSQETINFIKIDIEGFEYATLLGLENTLKKHQPKILIEILDDLETEEAQEKVHEFLYNLGYKKLFITDEGELSEIPTCLHRKNYLFTMN